MCDVERTRLSVRSFKFGFVINGRRKPVDFRTQLFCAGLQLAITAQDRARSDSLAAHKKRRHIGPEAVSELLAERDLVKKTRSPKQELQRPLVCGKRLPGGYGAMKGVSDGGSLLNGSASNYLIDTK